MGKGASPPALTGVTPVNNVYLAFPVIVFPTKRVRKCGGQTRNHSKIPLMSFTFKKCFL
jgi:hypothetical protein